MKKYPALNIAILGLLLSYAVPTQATEVRPPTPVALDDQRLNYIVDIPQASKHFEICTTDGKGVAGNIYVGIPYGQLLEIVESGRIDTETLHGLQDSGAILESDGKQGIVEKARELTSLALGPTTNVLAAKASTQITPDRAPQIVQEAIYETAALIQKVQKKKKKKKKQETEKKDEPAQPFSLSMLFFRSDEVTEDCRKNRTLVHNILNSNVTDAHPSL